MSKQLFLMKIPVGASEDAVRQIFEKRLKNFTLSLKLGKIQGTQIGFLTWHDDVDEVSVIDEFKGTPILDGSLELKPYNSNYKNKQNATADHDIHLNQGIFSSIKPPAIPSGTRESAIVTNYVAYNRFHVHIEREKEELMSMSKKMRFAIPQCNGLRSLNDARLNFVYGAMYKADLEWHRVKVLSHGASDTVEVEFVDFGNQTTLSYKDLRVLPKELSVTLPRLAHHCTLFNVQVAPGMAEAFNEEFERRIVNKQCEIVIDRVEKTGPRSYDPSIWHVDIWLEGRNFVDEMLQRKILVACSGPSGDLYSLSSNGNQSALNFGKIGSSRGPLSGSGSNRGSNRNAALSSPSRSGRESPALAQSNIYEQPISGRFGDGPFADQQSNNSSIAEKSDTLPFGVPIAVTILHMNVPQMEVVVRLADQKHGFKWSAISNALTKLANEVLSSLRLGATVDVSQMYLANHSNSAALHRCRILRPVSSGHGANSNTVPSSAFGGCVTVSFPDDGRVEDKFLVMGVVNGVFTMPSESILRKLVGDKAAAALLKCPPLAKVCRLDWARFNLQLPPMKRSLMEEEMEKLRSIPQLLAKFDDKERWVDFMYLENEAYVSWKEQLFIKGVLTISGGTPTPALQTYPVFTEDSASPSNNPAILAIKQCFPDAHEYRGVVTYVSNYGEIYICLQEDRHGLDIVQQWYSAETDLFRSTLISPSIRRYDIYGTLSEGVRMRFRVLRLDETRLDQVYGQFIDFGSCQWVSSSSLFALSPEVADVKPLARKFVLDDLIGTVANGEKFKAKVEETFLNRDVVVWCRKLASETVTPNEEEPGIPYLYLCSQTTDVFSLVNDLIVTAQERVQEATGMALGDGSAAVDSGAAFDSSTSRTLGIEENMRKVIKQTLLYRLLFSSHLGKTLERLLNTPPQALATSYNQWREVRALRANLRQVQRTLEEKTQCSDDVDLEELQSFLDERQRLAETLVSKTSAISTLSVNSKDAISEDHRAYLNDIENGLTLIRQLRELLGAECTNEKVISDIGQGVELTFQMGDLHVVWDEVVTSEIQTQLDDVRSASDHAQFIFEEANKKWMKAGNSFSHLYEKPLEVLQFDEEFAASDMHLSIYLRSWHDCLSAELRLCSNLAADNCEKLALALQAASQHLQQWHATLKNLLGDPSLSEFSQEALALQQPFDSKHLNDHLQRLKTRLRKANAALLHVRADLLEIEPQDTSAVAELEDRQTAAIHDIHILWLEEAHALDELVEQAEIRPELKILHRESFSPVKYGVHCSWDMNLIKRQALPQQDGFFLANFANQHVIIRDFSNPPAPTVVKKWLFAYRRACSTASEPTLLPILAAYASSDSPFTETTHPKRDGYTEKNAPSSSSLNVIMESPSQDISKVIWLRWPLDSTESVQQLEKVAAEVPTDQMTHLLWSGMQALRSLFGYEELKSEVLPVCCLVSENEQSWKLRMAAPALTIPAEEDARISLDTRVQLGLRQLSQVLRLHKREEFGWFHDWIEEESFSLLNAKAIFDDAKQATICVAPLNNSSPAESPHEQPSAETEVEGNLPEKSSSSSSSSDEEEVTEKETAENTSGVLE